MNKSKQTSWITLTTIILFLFIGANFYFFSLLSNHDYIGIRAKKVDNDWVIKKVHTGGAAHKKDVLQNDQLILINNKIPQKNLLLNRWLIVEQAKSIVILRANTPKTIFFSQQNSNSQPFLLFFSLSLTGLIFLIRLSRQQLLNKNSKQFYFLGVTLIFTCLAVIPSSIGDFLGRIIIVFFISSFPIHLFFFLNGFRPKITTTKAILFVLIFIGICNIFLTIISYFTPLPNIVIEYLALGIFYFLGAILCFLLIDSFKGSKVNPEQNVTQLNLSLISLLSFLPLFLFYVLPTSWTAPFYLVVLFTVLPVFGILHLLTLSRFIKSRHRMSKSMLYFLLSFLLSVTLFLILLLNTYIPLWILCPYLFVLLYSFLPVIEETLLTVGRSKESSDPLALFVAIEDERENIAIFIHDTVVQDVIYTMKRIEDSNVPVETTKLALMELDEVIFSLRELCSDIYPLMIQEIGLTKTIVSMINQMNRQHPLDIFYTIDAPIEQYSPKINNFILRSLKELINNSILHGKAKKITIMISYQEKKCMFNVSDDGQYNKMTPNSQSHFGLDVIKEKLTLLGGELFIDYSSQTTISMILPINNEKE